MSRLGLLFFPAFDWSLGHAHPEREERLLYTRDQIFEEGILDLPFFKEYPPKLAGLKDICRTHALLPNPDNLLSPPHQIAAGGPLILAKALMDGEIDRGFALIRPPGHHAMHTVYGNRGFCSINNVAVLINHLRHTYGIKRLAVVDTDVHHGDGTQDIFYHDPDILFISIHQDGRTLYPGSGFPGERGGPQALDRTLNIPLPPGSGDEALLYIMEELVLPELERFKPQVVINSAGQDNHFSDPLAGMNVTAKGYADISKLLKPDLAVLEGGYAIETALPYTNLAIMLAMAGLDYGQIREGTTGYSSVSLNTIRPLVDALKTRNRKRPEQQDWYISEKSIFYDTEYIWEKRLEKVRGCKDCAGLHLTYTGSSRAPGPRPDNLVIRLPFQVCQPCRSAAEQVLAEAKRSNGFKVIYWQDQAEDRYVYYADSIREMTNE